MCSNRQAQSQTWTLVRCLQFGNVINSYMPYIYFEISYLSKNNKYYCLFHILFKRTESYTNYDNRIKRKVFVLTEQQDELKSPRTEFREQKYEVSMLVHAKCHEVPNKSYQTFQSLHSLFTWKKLTAGLISSNF